MNIESTMASEPAAKLPKRNKPASKNALRKIILLVRDAVIAARLYYFTKVLGMDIHPTARFSVKAYLDQTNPKGVHIGAESYVSFNAVILTHDMSRLMHADTRIGKRCFIGANAIILPGVTVGDECIIGSGSVVTKDVPSNSVCVGNPARVIRSGIKTRKWGILADIPEYSDTLEG